MLTFNVKCYIIVRLGQRTEGGNLSQPVLIPFVSYYAAFQTGNRELYRTNFMNTVRFNPAGLLGCEVLPKRWKYCWREALIAVLFSLVNVGIEYVQYHFSMGLVEADDVIHSTFGTLLGLWPAVQWLSQEKQAIFSSPKWSAGTAEE